MSSDEIELEISSADKNLATAAAEAALRAALHLIANTELDQLEQYNCARYNLARDMTQRWIDAGRLRWLR